jgi:hypothetical protein
VKHRLFLILLAVALIPSAAHTQTPMQWQDPLVDQMVGTWCVEGQVMGRPAHHDMQADWVLHHQFLRIHEKTSAKSWAMEPAKTIRFASCLSIRTGRFI